MFLLALLSLIVQTLAAQTLANHVNDPTVLKQFIIFGRHSVRSATAPDATLATLASQPYPDFGVGAALLGFAILWV